MVLTIFKTFSPVVKPCTVKIILSLTVTHHWSIRQLDVNKAFLNGVLTENVFMHQSEGFIDATYPSHMCKLNQALYGLTHDRLKGSLFQCGFQASKSDTSLFIQHAGQDKLHNLIYVMAS